MTPSSCLVPRNNPFATRYVRPGALPYRFDSAANTSLRQLLARWQQQGWRGAIIGPHGSGKSTLLASLLAQVDAMPVSDQPPAIYAVSLHDGQKFLPRGWLRRMAELARQSRRPVLVVDGYEQLSWLARFGLRTILRVTGWGILVTAHAPVEWPALYQTPTSEPLAIDLVRQITAASGISPPEELVQAAYRRCQGNQRELFFELYDWAEQQSPQAAERL